MTDDRPKSPRPVDPETGKPLPPREQPGYYPGYHVMDQEKVWDAATRALVRGRLDRVPPIRFFTPAEAALLQVVFDRLLPQEDRTRAHRIPIVPFVDERLFLGNGDGYRYETMPPDPEAYRQGLAALEEMAGARFGKAFGALEVIEQELLLQGLHQGKPEPRVAAWERMEPHRFFLLLIHDAVGVYYAHPWAWDEIGFGGPAYPRGYMRLERGEPEPWEKEERRYAWAPPPDSLSARFQPMAGADEHHGAVGQEGTH